MHDIRECRRCGGDVFGDGSHQLCDQCLDVVLFGIEKKSDHQLTSFSSPSQTEIDDNTRQLRMEYREEINEYTRLSKIFKVLRAWNQKDTIDSSDDALALDAKLLTPSDVTSMQFASAFIAYKGRDGSERAWQIRDYLTNRGVDVFTYTLPGTTPSTNMSMDQTLEFLRQKIENYAIITSLFRKRYSQCIWNLHLMNYDRLLLDSVTNCMLPNNLD